MSNPLQQTIEALAKEKGIEPDVVISAIEEAVATASRKYYKTGENLKTRFNTETGQVDLFALKTVVEEVVTPATEISINEAREMYRPLRQEDDYRRFAGRYAKIVLREKIDGQGYFKGRLAGVENHDLFIDAEDGRRHRVPIGVITRANLEVEF